MTEKGLETKLVQISLKGNDLEKYQQLKEYLGLHHDSEVLRISIHLAEKTLFG